MTEQVTKPKSEGRVAAGKRLVEWNRKNKENLVKNKEQVESSGDSSNLSSDQPKKSRSAVVYGGLAIVVVIGVALYLYRGASRLGINTTPSKPPPAPEHDIFSMD